MDWVTLRSRGKELVRKYRYVLLVVLAGLFLMALPDGKNTKAAPEPAAAQTEPRQDLQTALEEIISRRYTRRTGIPHPPASGRTRFCSMALTVLRPGLCSRSIPLLISARSSYARGRTARPSGLPS